MSRFYYDLHMHSCLSPCADSDMTPANIAGMCYLSKLDIAALTDHNSVKNCPAFFKAAANYGIVPVAGMELTTAEDIHMVCLFEDLQTAFAFEEKIDPYRLKIKNNTSVYNEQRVMDEEDNVIEVVENFLSPSILLPIEDAYEIAVNMGGVCYPAHVDRETNSAIAILGDIPQDIPFDCVEFANPENIEGFSEKYPSLRDKRKIVGSDAHALVMIRDRKSYFELDGKDEEEIRKNLFEVLRKSGS